MLTPSVPSRSLRSSNGINFYVLRLRPTLVQGLFALAASLCGIGSLSLSGQLLQQHLSRDVWRHIFLIWLSLLNCLHTRLSVDVFGPNLGFSLLDTDLLVRHWAWPPLGYWCNRSTHLIWFDLIWFDLIWFDLIWFDLIWFDLIWFGFDLICSQVKFRAPLVPVAAPVSMLLN